MRSLLFVGWWVQARSLLCVVRRIPNRLKSCRSMHSFVWPTVTLHWTRYISHIPSPATAHGLVVMDTTSGDTLGMLVSAGLASEPGTQQTSHFGISNPAGLVESPSELVLSNNNKQKPLKFTRRIDRCTFWMQFGVVGRYRRPFGEV